MPTESLQEKKTVAQTKELKGKSKIQGRTLVRAVINLGKLQIPVRFVPMSHEAKISFHQIHKLCGARIFYKKKCSTCEKEVQDEEIGKIFDAGDGNVIQISDDEIKQAKDGIQRFTFIGVTNWNYDPHLVEKSYVLLPEKKDMTKFYWLLQKSLESTDKKIVGRLKYHSKDMIVAIRNLKNKLVADIVRLSEDVLDLDSLEIAPTIVSPKELDLMNNLVEKLSGEVDYENLQSHVREALTQKLENAVMGKLAAPNTNNTTPKLTESETERLLTEALNEK